MLSAFASYASDQFIQKSVAFTFYIKIDSVPSTESTILYYFIYNVQSFQFFSNTVIS